MRRRDDYDRDDYGDNNFDRMFDAGQYGGQYRQEYDDYDRRPPRRDDRRRDARDYREGAYEEEPRQPKKRSFFRSGARRRDNREVQEEGLPANQFVVMTPKKFEDITGIIDNLKLNRALIVDICKLNDKSIQRVMDYINGAVYALDGSIQRINPAVFLLTPTGMGISVPIDYIKDKWERNKKK